jgi:hypothetical protein
MRGTAKIVRRVDVGLGILRLVPDEGVIVFFQIVTI